MIVVKSLSHPRAQLRDSRGVDVVGEILIQRSLGGVLDGIGSVEIGLAGAEVDDVDSVRRTLSASALACRVAEGVSSRTRRDASCSFPLLGS